MKNTFGSYMFLFPVILLLLTVITGGFCHYDIQCPPGGQDNFEAQVKDAGDKLVVAELHASWCIECLHLALKVHELEILYGDRVQVLKIDIDNCLELTQIFQVTVYPTFIFILKQELVGVSIGSDPDKLEIAFAEYMPKQNE